MVLLSRSDIVGESLAIMLKQKVPGADPTVTVFHSQTRSLADIGRSADTVVAAIRVPRFVTHDTVKPGAVPIDVGIDRVDGKLVGDVDFEPVPESASAITPAPGRVAPMTIKLLLENPSRRRRFKPN